MLHRRTGIALTVVEPVLRMHLRTRRSVLPPWSACKPSLTDSLVSGLGVEEVRARCVNSTARHRVAAIARLQKLFSDGKVSLERSSEVLRQVFALPTTPISRQVQCWLCRTRYLLSSNLANRNRCLGAFDLPDRYE